MQKLTDHVYGVLKFGAYMNAYVVDNHGALTIVDTGLSDSFAADIEKGIQSIGRTLRDVRQIFITHCHFDHVGGLAALQRKINVPTLAHRLDAPVIRGEQPPVFAKREDLSFASRWMLPFLRVPDMPSRVEIDLNDEEALGEILPGAKAMHLPGHSYGQVGLWLESEKTLLCGDAMMHFPWGVRMPLRAPSPDWNAVKDSIKKIAAMNVDNLFFGHGKPIVGGAAARVRELARRL